MSKAAADIEKLRRNVFSLIIESREQLTHGNVDLSDVETAVRAYCEGLSAMSVEEGRQHVPHLQALSEAMNLLEDDLKAAQMHIQKQLAGLGQRSKAHRAYIKSDGIGEKYFAPDAEEE